MTGFVEGAREAEAERSVEIDGRFIVCGDFEVRAFDAGFAKADQAFGDECPAQPDAAVFGGDADVLNGAHDATGDDGLNGATIDGVFIACAIPGDEPGTRGEEIALAGDVVHQFATAINVSQAGKNACIHFRAEAVVFGDRVSIDGGEFPGRPSITAREWCVFEARRRQLDFHSKSTKISVAEIHESLAENEEPNRNGAKSRILNFTTLYTTVNWESGFAWESACFLWERACRVRCARFEQCTQFA